MDIGNDACNASSRSMLIRLGFRDKSDHEGPDDSVTMPSVPPRS